MSNTRNPVYEVVDCISGLRIRLDSKTASSARREAKKCSDEYGLTSYQIMIVDLSGLSEQVAKMFK